MTYSRFALLLTLTAALLWSFSVALHGQDLQPDRSGEGSAAPAEDGEAGDDAAESEEEGEEQEITPGAESPRQAAELFLGGLKERKLPQVLAMLDPSVREQFEDEGIGEALLKALTLESFSIKEVATDGANATVNFEWKAKFDLNALINALLSAYAQSLRDEGLSDEEAEFELEFLRELLREVLAEARTQFERETQRMTLMQRDERWFVREPVELPDHLRRMFAE